MKFSHSMYPAGKPQYQELRTSGGRTVFEHLYSMHPRQSSQPAKKKKPDSNLDRMSSPFRIEVKLSQRQALSSRKIEALRKKKEEEELQQLKSKPTISRKSQELAQKAEEKFFEEYTVSYTDSFTKKATQVPPSFSQKKPPRSSSAIPSRVSQQRKKNTPLSLFNNQFSIERPFDSRSSPKEVRNIEKSSVSRTAKRTPDKKDPKNSNSFYYMTVLERNKYWIDQRKEHLKQLKEDREKEEMKDCTFNPVCYSKVPTMYQQFSPSQLKASLFVSQNSKFDPLRASIFGSKFESVYTDAVESVSLPMQSEYSPISPFQLQVSFQAGCDMGNFFRRREAN